VALRELITIDVRPGGGMDSQSGLQNLRPRLYGALERPSGHSRWAAIIMHPTSNFLGHYLISPLAERGVACLALNSRYLGSDVTLLMERVIQDLGAGVRFLKEDLGYERVALIGNSGGGALATFYQAQAERLTITATPAGDPIRIDPADLPPADAIILSAAHLGRARLLLDWIDPAIVNEHDPLRRRADLDLFNGHQTAPFEPEFLARFASAQRARRDRIESWVEARLATLRRRADGITDEAFVIHGTQADPRQFDLSLDANDRAPGSIWGPSKAVNFAGNAMGRFTTLTAFMSQWSSRSQADGPVNLRRTSVPVLLLEHTADGSTFPSTAWAWLEAAPGRAVHQRLVGGDHYLTGRPDLIAECAESIAAFLKQASG
jgi:pimeloyl-ACP methyl ester carboxylesterase